jgi:hypothetical protein
MSAFRAAIRIDGRTIALRGGPPDLAGHLRHNFSALVRRTAGRRPDAIVELVPVARVSPSMAPRGAFRLRGAAVSPFGDRRVTIRYRRRLSSLRLFYDVVEPVLINVLKRFGYVTIHAAAVAKGREGALILGPGGAGKTTLAYRLCREGWRMVANDQVYLSFGRGGVVRMQGARDSLAFQADAIDLFPELEPIRRRAAVLHGRVPKWHLAPEDLGRLRAGLRWASDTDRIVVTHLLFPHQQSRARTVTAESVSAAEAFARLDVSPLRNMQSILDDPIAVRLQFRLLTTMVKQAEAYRIVLPRMARRRASARA